MRAGDGSLVERARDYATDAHRRIDHRRKYSQQPYEVHLKSVAGLVANVSDDTEMIAAAWLHDIVEDTEVTLEQVGDIFGPGVSQLVYELTDVSRPGDGNRAARKAIDRNHLARASPRAQTVKLADLCDNAVDITRGDAKFARVFLAEMRELLGVLVAGDTRLRAQAERILERCERQLARASARPAECENDRGGPAGTARRAPPVGSVSRCRCHAAGGCLRTERAIAAAGPVSRRRRQPVRCRACADPV